ncbi:ABC transporter [Komagataeibacter xylinus]|uniref:ABC transporter n=1 Tax=Komagataeibacter xylinus TaxID=28448 RepID=A0A318PLV5_KOMXY|nr:ABC transporter ATP-binding protein [Komagataeibacter xylinus]PYD55996.1 ABC transporter [Komagataeibacter xylinus]GBQ77960.1 oligopeptide/dipeptide ABC transporter ATPase subunit [Komagataeibacter xylinus NBRC 15237]
MTHMISVSNLEIVGRRRHGPAVPIVRDVSLDVAEGQMLALIGESGSGKTTIALSLLGHARAGCAISGGRIMVAGHDVTTMTAGELRAFRGRTISYVAQNAGTAFNPALSLGQQVIEPARVHWSMTRAQAEHKMIDLFRALALPDPETIGARYPHQLSGGQLQRLMAAMALVTDPEIVVFDEPTTALDVTTQIEVLAAFRSVLADRGITGVYVTHDLAVVAQIADHAVVLRHGQVRESGPVAEILGNPRDDYTRELVAACRIPPRTTFPAPVLDRAVETVLDLSGVIVGYGRLDAAGLPERRILDEVSLSVPRGSTLGIIGESGCGKSTLARTISGLQPWAAGQVTFRGEALAPDIARRTREQRRRLQIVAQNADMVLNPAWRIGASIERVLTFFRGLKGAEARNEAARLLDMVRLPHALLDRLPGELSGGQKQRINFARALAARPDLVLCDEITAALDPVVAAAILELMAELQRELGISYIFITHDLHAVRAVCDDVAVLYGGKVVEHNSSQSLTTGAHHPYTRLLVSSVPEMRAGWLTEAMTARQAGRPEPLQVAPQGGCRFFPRCDVRMPGTCDHNPVPVQILPGGARIACFTNAAALVPDGDDGSCPDFHNRPISGTDSPEEVRHDDPASF